MMHFYNIIKLYQWGNFLVNCPMCFLHLFSVRSMQRNTPGLLDRRIGPKDMFIVLLYMYVCICCQLFRVGQSPLFDA